MDKAYKVEINEEDGLVHLIITIGTPRHRYPAGYQKRVAYDLFITNKKKQIPLIIKALQDF